MRNDRSAPPPPAVRDATWISLGNAFFTLVDDADVPLVSQYTWYRHKHGYATAKIDGRAVRMHQLLIGKYADHKNLDRLDNRRANLRPADHRGNMRNRSRLKNSTSGYKGVYRFGDRWGAKVTTEAGRVQLGYFATPEEAAAAYDAAAIRAHGEFARTNAMEGL